MDTASNWRRRRITKVLAGATVVLGVATLGAWSDCGSGGHHAHRAPYAATSMYMRSSYMGSSMYMAAPTQPSTANAPAAPAAANKVSIAGFAFSPASLTVNRGTTVTWTNSDSAAHNVVGGPLNSPTLNQGASYSYTFKSAGTFSYICTFHPFMHGTVTVK